MSDHSSSPISTENNSSSTLAPTPAASKGFGSFQSPSVELLIHQSESEYVAPPLPNFIRSLGIIPDDLFDRDGSLQPTAFRRLFYLDPSWCFINHGAFGASIRTLMQVRNQWSIEMESQPLKFIDRQLLPLLVHTTRKMANWLKVPLTSLTLHTNATTAINILLCEKNYRFMNLKDGARVLRLNITYGAVKKILDSLPGLVNVELDVPLPLASKSVLLDLVGDALDKNPPFSLAVFDHISSNSGLKLPIRELTKLCHSYNVPVLIDGAHSLGSVSPDELDLVGSEIDYFVGNTHKWLCNPKGAAFMYISPKKLQQHKEIAIQAADDNDTSTKAKLQSSIHPLILSHGTGSGYTSDFIWTGCQDYSTLLTLISTIDLWDEVSLPRVIHHTHALVMRAGRYLAKLWKTELIVGHRQYDGSQADGDQDDANESELVANMLCVRLPGSLDPDEDEHNLIQNLLHFQYKIEVPIKVLGQPKRLYVRISSWVYNTFEEYEKLGAAMLEIRGSGHAKSWEEYEQANATETSSSNGITNGTSISSSTSTSSSFFPEIPPVLLRPDHTQICIPIGCESQARAFYIDLLGMAEVPRPVEMSQLGGFWLYCGPKPTVTSDDEKPLPPHANVHISTESLASDHYSRSRAHIAYSVRGLESLRKKLTKAGFKCTDGLKLPTMERFDIRDPFGNRIEFIEHHSDPHQPVVEKEYFWRSKRAYENKPLLKVGVFQGQSFPCEVDKNIEIIREQLQEAKRQGADLVLFAELFITGYALSREDTHRLAMEQSSEPISRLREICRDIGIGVCVGYPELVRNHAISPTAADCSCCNPTDQRCVYNSAILIDDKGEILMSYRKTHLWEAVEKSFFTQGCEEQLKIVNYKGVAIGINICYDIEFGEPSRVLALAGCQLLLVPTALAKGAVHEMVPMKVVPTRAIDNHCWIAYSNHIGPSYKDSSFCGLSGLIGPDGLDLRRASDSKSELLVDELNPHTYAERFETTPLLVDRRAELFETIAQKMLWK